MENKINVSAECWLKNNTEWYYPNNKVLLDLSVWDYVDLLSRDYYGDLFYCYNKNDKDNGRLFKGKWNDGTILYAELKNTFKK